MVSVMEFNHRSFFLFLLYIDANLDKFQKKFNSNMISYQRFLANNNNTFVGMKEKVLVLTT